MLLTTYDMETVWLVVKTLGRVRGDGHSCAWTSGGDRLMPLVPAESIELREADTIIRI